MRCEYFKPGDRVLINDPTSNKYNPNLICKITKDQYHQWIYTDVYGWVDVTCCNCHPVVLEVDVNDEPRHMVERDHVSL